MKRAVIYARFSSHNQTEQSIEGQVRICKAYAKQNDLEVIEVYADRAISGRTDRRPEFQRMIADSAKKKFEAVIVYKTDRFARDKYDSAVYKQTLKKHNVTLHYAAENIPQGPEGILIESLMEGLAEYYSAELSQKVQRGLYESALKCHSTGANKPFGYKTAADKSFQIDEWEARGVKMIFDMFIQGAPVKEICDKLNSLGYRTSRGGEFNKSSINRIINNEKYIGIYQYKDIRVEDGIPAIIGKDVFYAAQKVMEGRKTKRAHKSAKVKYLLSGKLYCGHCKSPMTGVSGTGCQGDKFYYYYCQKMRNKKGCDKKPAGKDWIENLVVDETIKNILRKDVIQELSKKLCAIMREDKSTDDDIAYCKKKLAENKRAIDNLMKMVMEGLGTKSMTEKIKELEHEQTALQGELEYLNKINFKLTEEHIEFMLLTMLESADRPDYKEKIIGTFVSEVYLYDDKLVIYYNMSDGYSGLKSSDLEEIERCSIKDSSASATSDRNIKNTVEHSLNESSTVGSNGGADENRTRVRKQIHSSFSECRLCFAFPLPKLRSQSLDISSSLCMAGAGTLSYARSPLVYASACAVVLTGETKLLRQLKLILYC